MRMSHATPMDTASGRAITRMSEALWRSLFTRARAGHVASTTSLHYSTSVDILTTVLNKDVAWGGHAWAIEHEYPKSLRAIARKLGVPADLQVVGQAGIPAVLSAGPSEADVIKEKELLGALDRRGKLTAAAFETSLSVEEAEQMLDALAVKGHPEDTVEHGRLVYAHREHEV